MTSCGSGAGYTIVGESARLDPKPRFEEIDLLVFDLDGHSLQQVIRFASDSGVRLVAIARDACEDVLFDAVEAGVCGFLPRSWLTPETLVSCLHAVANGSASRRRRSTDCSSVSAALRPLEFQLDVGLRLVVHEHAGVVDRLDRPLAHQTDAHEPSHLGLLHVQEPQGATRRARPSS
jgi:hypothetical protein